MTTFIIAGVTFSSGKFTQNSTIIYFYSMNQSENRFNYSIRSSNIFIGFLTALYFFQSFWEFHSLKTVASIFFLKGYGTKCKTKIFLIYTNKANR